MKGWRKEHLSDIEPIEVTGTLQWTPVRRQLGIEAFGVNAFIAVDAGHEVVERHTEEARHHEELYVVVAGRATFSLDGEETDAPAGTVIFISDPAVERFAVASEPETTVLAVGARRGVAYTPGPWEPVYIARALGQAGDYEGAIAELQRGLELHPDHRMLLYRLANWEALAGKRDDALDHLAKAVAESDALREQAQTDDAFASIRDDPRFPAAN